MNAIHSCTQVWLSCSFQMSYARLVDRLNFWWEIYLRLIFSGFAPDIFDAYSWVRQARRELDASSSWEYCRAYSNGQVEFSGSILVKFETTDYFESFGQWIPQNFPTKWYDLANFTAWLGKDWFCQDSSKIFKLKRKWLKLQIRIKYRGLQTVPLKISNAFQTV